VKLFIGTWTLSAGEIHSPIPNAHTGYHRESLSRKLHDLHPSTSSKTTSMSQAACHIVPANKVSTTTMSAPKPASLLGCARELRDMIYALAGTCSVICKGGRQIGRFRSTVTLKNLPSSSLLCVNRQIGHEYRECIGSLTLDLLLESTLSHGNSCQPYSLPQCFPTDWMRKIDVLKIRLNCSAMDLSRPSWSDDLVDNNAVQQVRVSGHTLYRNLEGLIISGSKSSPPPKNSAPSWTIFTDF